MIASQELFCEVLSHLTSDEEAWLHEQLEGINFFGDQSYAVDDTPDNLDLEDADWGSFELARTVGYRNFENREM